MTHFCAVRAACIANHVIIEEHHVVPLFKSQGHILKVHDCSGVRLPLETHTVSPAFLLVKLEIVGAQPESTEKTVSKFFEFGQHLVLFLFLLRSDSCGERVECALRLMVDGR